MRYVVAIGIIFTVLAFVLLPKVPSAGRAERLVANSSGLSNVHVTGRRYAWGALGGCKGTDVTLFHVVGTAPDGTTRKVDVCAPILGGYTVRG